VPEAPPQDPFSVFFVLFFFFFFCFYFFLFFVIFFFRKQGAALAGDLTFTVGGLL